VPSRSLLSGLPQRPGRGLWFLILIGWRAQLRASYSGRCIDVLNRGKGGEEAPVEVLRFERDVIAENPCLVIWQIGTIAAWRGQDIEEVVGALRDGLRMLKPIPVDVILMYPQYVPAVLTQGKRPLAELMVRRVHEVADEAEFAVNVFQRFELMRQWHEIEQISFDTLVDPDDVDRLRQSDASVRRMAAALHDLIVACQQKTQE
jgi:hypothetical protein